ncbi:MAG: DUF4129 domain-containing protein [Acidimicrobiales bacterium]
MLSSTVDPREARREARDILSGAEYSPPEQSPIERAVYWLFDRLGDAIATLTGGGPGSIIGWAIVILLGAGAIWLLVRALAVPSVPAPDRSEGLRYGTETHRDAAVWAADAERLAAAGDHRGALRCRHQALVARLVTHTVVDDVPGRTASEYRDLLAGRISHEAGTASRVTERFETAWYGGRPVDAGDYDRFANDCLRLESALLDTMVDA